MVRIIIALALTLVTLAGCQTVPNDGKCNDHERGRLAGLRTGVSIAAPDPATAKGKAVYDEIALLEAECPATQ